MSVRYRACHSRPPWHGVALHLAQREAATCRCGLLAPRSARNRKLTPSLDDLRVSLCSTFSTRQRARPSHLVCPYVRTTERHRVCLLARQGKTSLPYPDKAWWGVSRNDSFLSYELVGQYTDRELPRDPPYFQGCPTDTDRCRGGTFGCKPGMHQHADTARKHTLPRTHAAHTRALVRGGRAHAPCRIHGQHVLGVRVRLLLLPGQMRDVLQ